MVLNTVPSIEAYHSVSDENSYELSDASEEADKEKMKISNDGVKDISGYFIAPMTGEFKFYTSCSHPCEVYLSPDTEGEHRSRIISQHHKSGPKSFESSKKAFGRSSGGNENKDEQVSKSIHMEEGKRYFIQALQDEKDENSRSYMS